MPPAYVLATCFILHTSQLLGIVSNQVLAQAKTDSAHIAAGSHLVGTHLKGQADLLMTQMDNDTAKETAKKTKAA